MIKLAGSLLLSLLLHDSAWIYCLNEVGKGTVVKTLLYLNPTFLLQEPRVAYDTVILHKYTTCSSIYPNILNCLDFILLKDA